MSQVLPLVVANQTAGQIEKLADWWRLNRSKAPDAVFEELSRAFELITRQPEAGPTQPHRTLQNLRRVYLSRIRVYLYYHVAENPRCVEVLAIWHASRDGEPSL